MGLEAQRKDLEEERAERFDLERILWSPDSTVIKNCADSLVKSSSFGKLWEVSPLLQSYKEENKDREEEEIQTEELVFEHHF